MIRIKSDWICVYYFDARLLFLFNFCFHGMDCTALGTFAYISEVVELVTFITLLSTCQALPQFVGLTAVFTSSSCTCCHSCCGSCFSLLAIFVHCCVDIFFISCRLLITTVWAFLASILFAQVNTFTEDVHILITFCQLLTFVPTPYPALWSSVLISTMDDSTMEEIAQEFEGDVEMLGLLQRLESAKKKIHVKAKEHHQREELKRKMLKLLVHWNVENIFIISYKKNWEHWKKMP